MFRVLGGLSLISTIKNLVLFSIHVRRTNITAALHPFRFFILLISTHAGLGWGAFCLRGKGSKAPLADMSMSFLLCTPAAVLLILIVVLGSNSNNNNTYVWSSEGVGVAIVCGAITSGLTYALLYHLLPKIATTTAAVAQLSVPIIAMVMGSLALSEEITIDIVIAASIVLGGIFLSIISKPKPKTEKETETAETAGGEKNLIKTATKI